MSLPYPVDNNRLIHIPDPENPIPQYHNNPPPNGFVGYPPSNVPTQLPYPTRDLGLMPQEPTGDYDQPYSYPVYPPTQQPNQHSFDETQLSSDLNEGLLSRTSEMLKIGKTAARGAADMLGFNTEKTEANKGRSHSYYYPKVPENGDASLSSYFRDLTKNIPSRATSMKVRNYYPDQDFKTLLDKSRRHEVLFEDPHFPASNRLLTENSGGQTFVVTYLGRRMVRESEIEWLRPHEICERMSGGLGPEMIVGERDRFDINQGEIGDCWFLAALANLADNDECFDRVVPKGQGFRSSHGYQGIFRFRFFRFGEWVEVVVDDRLPCRNGRLIYLSAKDPNEFWSPLLEKAYAKLYGAYKNLEGGLTIEAAVDFTGGIPEMIDLSRLNMQKETLFYNMMKAYQANAFMSCSLSNSRNQGEGERLGLQARHAYTITKVVEVKAKGGRSTIPLIRMRNPHGNSREWKGDWSDNDPEWRNLSKRVKEELGLTFDDDGEFYMNFNRDFVRLFGEVEIVHLTPTSMLEEQKSSVKYEVFYFHGEWRGETAGGCGNDTVKNFVKNPQFMFSLSDPDPSDDHLTCPVIVSLAQKVTTRKTEHAIGFRIYKIPPGTQQLTYEFIGYNQPIGKTDQYINLREVSKRLQLPPGEYCVIPSTFNRGEEADFLVRTFTEKHWGSSQQAKGQSISRQGADGRAGSGKTRAFGGNTNISTNVINIPIIREGNQDAGPPEQEEPKRKRKRDRILNFMEKRLEKHCPAGASFIGKLKELYNFPQDRQSECALLRDIVNSVSK